LAAARGNPRILAFVCSWHPLAAADNAGVDRRSYGTATSIVPVDCAGVVSAAAIIRAFSADVDGVLIAACGRGDCHYSNGNESCERVVQETRDLMELAGLAPQRLRLDLSSDVDGGRFVALLDEFAVELAGLNGRGRSAQSRPAKRKPSRAKKAKAAVRKKPAKKTKAAVRKKPARAKTAAAKKTATGKRTSRKKSAAAGKKSATRVKKKVAPKKSAARAKRKR
jgi:coenzyme F420-reducing hydrogenase delta subunit